ncbi:MAG TPA: tyrosine-type recombinase/integrase [Terracidiphilus sp.]|jgi:integrase/recombinase XerC/integrase/recombinase XerD
MNSKSFLNYLATRTSSKETLRAYRQDLLKFESFLRSKGLKATQVKQRTIAEYLNHLVEQRGRELAPATIARRLAVISEYYEFLRANSDGRVANPVKAVKRPKVQNDLPRAVDNNTLEKLIQGIKDARDKAIVLLFVESGLRLSELRNLNKDTIVPHRRQMPNGTSQYFGRGEVIGKGRKRRNFIVGPAGLQALALYIKAHRLKDQNPALFLSSRHKRISCRTIQHTVDKWCQKLGLSHVHAHQLRHSFATRNVNAGMSAAVLQELLGHASLKNSQRYFRVQPERLSREYFAAMEFIRQTSPL